MRSKDPVVAIALSDVHLSLKPPIARAEEPSWHSVMARTFDEVKDLQKLHGGQDCRILCAGDLFDKWNTSAEMINSAMSFIPEMYSIPGNHDLPMHSNDLVHRSAYQTLVHAGILHTVGKSPITLKTPSGFISLYGAKLGRDLPKRIDQDKKYQILHVCLVHEYLWVPGSEYTGAPQDTRLGSRAKRYKDFDVVVVGDNHMGFIRKLKNGTTVINCGTVFRRKSNEAHYRPQVGLIRASGKVTSHKLDISKDVITELDPDDKLAEGNAELNDLMDELKRLEEVGLDFKDALKRAMESKQTRNMVKKLILEAIDTL